MGKCKRFNTPNLRVVGSVLVFLVAVLSAVTLKSSTAQAAPDLQSGCFSGVNAQDGVAGLGTIKSPFASTPDVCLGMETNAGFFFQLAVVLSDGDVSKTPQVTAVDNLGNNIPMKQDTRNTLFVSAVPVHAQKDAGICDANSWATITVSLSGKEYRKFEKQPICSVPGPSGFAHDTWVRTFEATSTARRFVGFIGINYGQAYSTDPNSQYHALQQNGVESIKITGGNCGTNGCIYGNSSREISLTDGSLSIDASARTPGVPYKVDLTYNARAVDNNMPYDEWLNHTFTFDNVVLNATGDTPLTPSDYNAGSLAYYDKNNKATAKQNPDQTQDTAPTCVIEGIGWLVCPVANFLAGVADGAQNILNDFLAVPAKAVFDRNNDTYKAWATMRNYANILFVIGFLIIVFSQLTSYGISNYGIKKLLPKLILVAILVNVSFYVCALAVDLSNILGYNLTKMLATIGSNISGSKIGAGDIGNWATDGHNFFVSTVAGMTATAVVGTIAFFNLAATIGLLISVIVTGFVIIVLLTIRQALIILLVVVAPLAFAAMLLPNTEGIFKKWWATFKSLLLVFPIIGLLYGAAKLASYVLQHAGLKNPLLEIVASALPILVLLLVISILKKVLDIIDGGANIAQRLQGGLTKLGDPFLNRAKLHDETARNRFLSGRLGGGRANPLNHIGSFFGRGQAKAETGLEESKAGLDAYKSGYVRNNKQMQKLTDSTAELNRQIAVNKMVSQNAGLQHLKDEHEELLEEEGRQKERERELNLDIDTIQIQGSQVEFENAQRAGMEKGRAEALRDATFAENKQLDTRLRTVDNQTRALKMREGIADKYRSDQFYGELSGNANLQAIAAGNPAVDQYSSQRVQATAKSQEVKAFNETVDLEKSTMTSFETPALSGIGIKGEPALDASGNPVTGVAWDSGHSIERRAAAISHIAARGSDEQLQATLDRLGQEYYLAEESGDTDKMGAIKSLQQQFVADMKPGRMALLPEFAQNTLREGHFGGKYSEVEIDPNTGMQTTVKKDGYKTYAELVGNRVTAKKISAEKIANMSQGDRNALISFLRGYRGNFTPEMDYIATSIQQYVDNPNNDGKIPAEIMDTFSTIKGLQ